MTDIKELIECSDLATRQVLWFYELCKSGVVRFSLKRCLGKRRVAQMREKIQAQLHRIEDEEHIKILTDIINKVNDYDAEKYKDEPELIQTEMASRHQLLYLISLQLLKFVET